MGMESAPRNLEGSVPLPEKESFVSEENTFLAGIRQSAEQQEKFSGTIGDQALGVMEDYFKLKEIADEKRPDLKGAFVGSGSNQLDAEVDKYKRLSLGVGGQYTIKLGAEGRLQIDAPMSGGDDALMYEVTEGHRGRLLGVDVDLKTGATSPELSPETAQRLQKVLQLSREYYKKVEQAAVHSSPLPLKAHERPNFPTEEIKNWRRNRKGAPR